MQPDGESAWNRRIDTLCNTLRLKLRWQEERHAMKSLSAIFVLAWLFPFEVPGNEQNLSIDAQLPKIGTDWVRRGDAAAKGDYSWVNFKHKKDASAVLSFVAQKVPPTLKVTSPPILQASIETFKSSGSAYHSTSERGQPISEIVRHRIVSINIDTPGLKREFDAIEYTYIYDGEVNGVSTMAHGYCIVVGDAALFVQHTSSNVIRSELAFEMVSGLLSKYLQLEGKPHSFSKGKVQQSNG